MATNDRTADLAEAHTDICADVAHHLAWVLAQFGAAAAADSAARLRELLTQPAT